MKKSWFRTKCLFFLVLIFCGKFLFAQDSSVEKTSESTAEQPVATSQSSAEMQSAQETQSATSSQTSEAPKTEKTTITIENARSTKYEKDKTTGNDVIILSGNVKVSVVRGSAKNVISAETIRYDRTTEMMYAEGNVELEQTTENAGNQTVTASSLMFNTATLEGVFDNGRAVQVQSDAINLPAGSTLIVASDIFGRSESNTITFKNGELTFCDDEDPHWRIKASRIWLLPGGEFAFLNARLYVGPVPVFYLPAFYYPKDELIFNPVFGYDKRNGYYIQTTTYLYGRKPLETSTTTTSSDDSDTTEKLKALFNFVKPSSLKEQKLEGLVLHNLDKDYSGNTTNYFKVMADYYSNLGYMVGLDGVFKPNNYITNLELNANLGFSNTVFSTDYGDYVPYAPSGDKVMDKSNLLGFELPFRYSGSLKMTMANPFTLSISLPVYSDPYFYDDFNYERSETMDWISYLIDSQNTDDDDDSTNEVSSFSWTLNSSYSVPLPAFAKPYVNSLSLSLNSAVAFSSMSYTPTNSDLNSTDLTKWQNTSPERKFYYPSSVTPVTFNGTLSGTLIDISSTKTKSTKTKKNDVKFLSSLSVPEEFLSDSEKEKLKNAEEVAKNSENQENLENQENPESFEKTENAKDIIPDSAFPNLGGTSSSTESISGIAYSMKYSIKPSLTTQLAYSSSVLQNGPDDFEWDEIKSSMYTFKLPITLDNNFSYGGNFFSVTNSNTFNPVWQKHPYIHTNEEGETDWYTESQAFSLKKTDYSAEKRDLTQTNSVSIKPFAYIKPIKDTGITWRSSIKLVRTEFLSDEFTEENDDPEWEYHFVDWTDEESITTNALDFTFATNQMDSKFTQSVTVSTTLKPLAESYYATTKFGFPLTTLAFETGVKKSSTDDDAEWVRQPLKQSLTVSGKVLGSSMSFSESYNYNMDEYYHDSMKLSFSWMNLSLAYQMSYTYGYDMQYDKDNGNPTGWTQRDEKEFLPYSFSFNYNSGTKTIYRWKNRVAMGCGLSSSIVADLIRPTNSYFTFAPSLSFKINEFVQFTFSASSKNSVIYRYFGNEIGLSGETNPFLDLIDSFRFDDEDKRKASGFKLKSLNFTLTHELHDWDFNTTFKVEPRLITENDGKKHYDFNPYITINITWRPMGAMKTEIIDDYGEWKLN